IDNPHAHFIHSFCDITALLFLSRRSTTCPGAILRRGSITLEEPRGQPGDRRDVLCNFPEETSRSVPMFLKRDLVLLKDLLGAGKIGGWPTMLFSFVVFLSSPR